MIIRELYQKQIAMRMRKAFMILVILFLNSNTNAQSSLIKDTLHFKSIERKSYSVKIENGETVKDKEFTIELLEAFESTAFLFYNDLENETIYFDKNQNPLKIINTSDSIYNIYDDQNLIFKKYEFTSVYDHENNGTLPKTRITEYHRYAGNEIKLEASYYENELLPVFIKHYHYNSKKDFTNIEFMRLTDTNIMNKHIDNPYVSISTFILKDDPENELLEDYHYVYDENGMLKEKRYQSKWQMIKTTYNNLGLETNVQMDNPNNERVLATLTYDKKNRLKLLCSTTLHNLEETKTEYTYTDDEIDSIKITNKDKVSTIKYTYKYDDHGNWIEKVISIDGTPQFIINRVISYY